MKEVPWNSPEFWLVPGPGNALDWAKTCAKIIDMGAAMDILGIPGPPTSNLGGHRATRTTDQRDGSAMHRIFQPHSRSPVFDGTWPIHRR